MTDELDQTAIGEPGATDPMENVVPAPSADSSIVAGIPTVDDIPSPTDVSREDVEDAAKWLWRHTLGGDDDDEPLQPIAPNVVFEPEEEVTMETSNVEHDDPPPPERPAGGRR